MVPGIEGRKGGVLIQYVTPLFSYQDLEPSYDALDVIWLKSLMMTWQQLTIDISSACLALRKYPESVRGKMFICIQAIDVLWNFRSVYMLAYCY
jgi:hypothetical protein